VSKTQNSSSRECCAVYWHVKLSVAVSAVLPTGT